MSEKYFGFNDWDSIVENFFRDEYDRTTHRYKAKPLPEGFPTADEIIFAAYGGGSYDGIAIVVYKKGGTLYEVNGSHCSCYGLEDQWDPEETSVDALRMRKLNTYEFDKDCIARFKELFPAPQEVK